MTWFNYDLSVRELDGKTFAGFDVLSDVVKKIVEIDADAHYYVPNGNGESNWPGADTVLAKVSLAFPDYILVLYETNDLDDDFRTYFYRGCMQIEEAQVSYGEFDLDKLQEVYGVR